MSLNKFGKREKKDPLDQFYTSDKLAKFCYEKVLEEGIVDQVDFVLEPAAGKGSFSSLFPDNKRVACDIDPKIQGVEKISFYDWQPQEGKTYCVITNPPFGRMCSDSVKFFNKSAEFSEYICFLIPRTFKRVSLQNRLSLDFELIENWDIEPNKDNFSPSVSVKCCFQIWKRTNVKRKIIKLPNSHSHWQFLKLGEKDLNNQPTPPKKADFALKAYGANCGETVFENLETLRPKSWHWIKTDHPKILANRFSQLDYSISKDTARQESIGRGELIKLYDDVFGNIPLEDDC